MKMTTTSALIARRTGDGDVSTTQSRNSKPIDIYAIGYIPHHTQNYYNKRRLGFVKPEPLVIAVITPPDFDTERLPWSRFPAIAQPQLIGEVNAARDHQFPVPQYEE